MVKKTSIWEDKKINPLEYCNLDRAAKLLNCEIYDLLHMAENKKIELCLRFGVLSTFFIFFKKEWISLKNNDRQNFINQWAFKQELDITDSITSSLISKINPSIKSSSFDGKALYFDNDSMPLCNIEGFFCVDSFIDAEVLSKGGTYDLNIRLRSADSSNDEQWILMRPLIHDSCRENDTLSLYNLFITRNQIENIYSSLYGIDNPSNNDVAPEQNSKKIKSVIEQRKDLIMSLILELNYPPLAIPSKKGIKSGKDKIRKLTIQKDRSTTPYSFDTAWKSLRAEGKIANCEQK